jgi:hypothetical protein
MELLALCLVYLGVGTAVHAATHAPSKSFDGVPLGSVVVGLALSGAVLGMGRLLASNQVITLRLLTGRAILASGLAVGAGSVLTFVPNLNLLAICGLAALFATLGEQFIEKLINAKFRTE